MVVSLLAKLYIVNVVSMHCQQPDNSNLFKGHGAATPVGAYG